MGKKKKKKEQIIVYINNIVHFVFAVLFSGTLFTIVEDTFLSYIPGFDFFLTLQFLNISINAVFGILFVLAYKAISLKLKKTKIKRPYFLLFLSLISFNGICAAVLKVNKSFHYVFLHPWSLMIDVAITAVFIVVCYVLYKTGVRLLSGIQPRKMEVYAFVFLVLVSIVTTEVLMGVRSGRKEYTKKAAYAAKRNSPNIIFILIDTFRFERLHCFGNPRELSDTLDSMFEESVDFTKAYSQSSWTKPAIASLFTGLYPRQHGAVAYGSGMSRDLTTYIELFREYGYDTAAFSANPLVTPQMGMDQGFEYFYYGTVKVFTVYGTYLKKFFPSILGIVFLNRSEIAEEAENLLGRAEKWIIEHKEHPFLVYIHLMDLHVPYEPPEEYIDMFLSDDAPSRDYKDLNDELMKYADEMKFFRPDSNIQMSDPRLVAFRDLYDAQIAYLDDQLEMFIEKMKHLGLFDDAIIVITGDHGEDFGDHNHLMHGDHVYNTLIHVPFMIRFPKNEYAKEIDTPISLFDAFPTIAEFIDMPVPKDLVAISRLEEIVSEKGGAPGPIYSHLYRYGVLSEAVLDSKWKLIGKRKNTVNWRMKYELFDIETDFQENENLADKYDEITKNMVSELNEINKKKKHAKSETVNMSVEMKEKLRQLGYVK